MTDKNVSTSSLCNDSTINEESGILKNMNLDDIKYWEEKLKNFPESSGFPLDKARSPVISAQKHHYEFIFSPTLIKKLKQLSEKQGTTLFMGLLASLQVLLYRYSDQTDIVVGTSVKVGFSTNTLALRSQLNPDQIFSEFLAQIKQNALEAYTHQSIPFEQLLEHLSISQHLNCHPLFQVMMIGRNNEGFPAIRTRQCDLILFVEELTEDGLKLHFEYAMNLFEKSTIETIATHFEVLLQSIIQHPEEKIAKLSLLTAEEKQTLLIDWNRTETAYPQEKTIQQLFEEHAEKIPNHIAVVFGEQKLTYKELNEKANQLAHYLRAQGVKADSLIAISLERSVELMIGILGILKAGGAYVPLDINYPEDRLNFMLDDTKAEILITSSTLREKFTKANCQKILIDNAIATMPLEENPTVINKPSDLAYVIYTSGSTGQPKGVMVTHQNVIRLVSNTNYVSISTIDKVAQASNISFDAATFEIWGALLNGAALISVSKQILLDTFKFGEFLQQKSISILFLTTAVFHQHISIRNSVFKDLKYFLVGGEVLNPEKINMLLENPQLSPQYVINIYGPTENTTFSSAYLIPGKINEETIPIGKPIANTSAYILNSHLEPVPINVTGELYVGSAGVARGYLNQLDLTAERFIANPFATEEDQRLGKNLRLYRTGDLARYLSDGNIEYLGRIDQQVKIRGFRIECGEIESILMLQEHVKVAVVIAREDEPGDKCLVAYIVHAQGMLNEGESSKHIEKLHQALAKQLPDYMVPNYFVYIEKLPLNANGKIDYKSLPKPHVVYRSEHKIAPKTAIEKHLAKIWSEVLKLAENSLSIGDHFFRLGGHSLLATRLRYMIEQRFKVEISLTSIFQKPHLSAMALEITNAKQSTMKALVKQPYPAHIPLSYAQQSLWVLDKLLTKKSVYNIHKAFKIRGKLNIAALTKAFNQIILRHESLRTNFNAQQSVAEQVISPDRILNFVTVDLSKIDPETREEQLKALVQTENLREFDLSQDLLIRGQLINLSENEQVLALTIHHIVFDGWSMDILMREISQFYNAYIKGEAITLPSLPIQYVDYALWQRANLNEDVLAQQLEYWKKQLKDVPNSLDLPLDKPRPKVPSNQGGSYRFSLPAELTKGLKQLSEKQETTLFMNLLAAFQILLYRYSGQTDIVVGSPIAGRQHQAMEDLIGFFVNTLVLRSQLEPEQNFNELLVKVKQTTLEAYTHQSIPFEHLVEQLSIPRDLSRNPLFQVMFVLHNNEFSSLNLNHLIVEPLLVETTTSYFDLALSAEELKSGELKLEFEYAMDLFEKSTIERIATHFEVLLQSIIQHPEEKIAKLPLLTAEEKQTLLIDWNRTETAYPQEKTIQQLFEEHAEKIPNHIAVVFGEQKLTYKELNEKANQLAHYLRAQGVKADSLIAISLERSIELMIGILGILKAGGAYVPLDINYPEDRLNFMLNDTKAEILITSLTLREKFTKANCQKILIDNATATVPLVENPTVINKPSDLAYVIYTSGSTGQPKGVMVTHQNVIRLVSNTNYVSISTIDKVAQASNISFDAATFEIWSALLNGAALIGVSKQILLDTFKFGAFLQRESISILCVPVALFNQHISIHNSTFKGLKYFLLGAEALNIEKMNMLLENPQQSPQYVINAYGPTESTTFCSTYLIPGKIPEKGTIPIGKPIANTSAYILNSHLELAPINVAGEYYVGGAGVARGYLNRLDLTAERFIANPFATEEDQRLGRNLRLYRTGDLARYLPDGNIEYLGRIDQQVKIRGFRIECGEIENLIKLQENIKDVIVIAREDEPGDKRLVAYLVYPKGMPNEEEASKRIEKLREVLSQQLPDYMVPSHFLYLEKLPLSVNGKLNSKALPKPEKLNPSNNFVPPQTEMEKALVNLWAKILKTESTVISTYDNFFALGGNSLLAVKMTHAIRMLFNVEIPYQLIFESPTIHTFAKSVYDIRQFKLEVKQSASVENLSKHVFLEPKICKINVEPSLLIRHIFLTGATGFLGAFLLRDILENYEDAFVYCLVRAENEEQGYTKIVDNLKKYEINDAKYKNRIIPVIGDLTLPKLGLATERFMQLSEKIDIIFHNGALVNHVYSYKQHAQANVAGTQEILRLSCHLKMKPVHYVSTLSVFPKNTRILSETISLDDKEDVLVRGGYPQSKWVAEKIIAIARERGLLVNIYRPAFIIGASKTGSWNIDDSLSRIIKGSIQLGKNFFSDVDINLVPVDYISGSIVYISKQTEKLGSNFHLANSQALQFNTLFEYIRSLGFNLQPEDYKTWKKYLVESLMTNTINALHAYLPVFSEEGFDEDFSMTVECHNTRKALEQSGITCDADVTQLLPVYLRHFMKVGYLPQPKVVHECDENIL